MNVHEELAAEDGVYRADYETTTRFVELSRTGGVMEEFVTQTGCTVKLIRRPDQNLLVLAMEQPGYGRRVEVMFTDEELRQLRTLLDRRET